VSKETSLVFNVLIVPFVSIKTMETAFVCSAGAGSCGADAGSCGAFFILIGFSTFAWSSFTFISFLGAILLFLLAKSV
jgi:hypothetical protein